MSESDTPLTKFPTGAFYLRCDDCPQPDKCERIVSVHPDDCAAVLIKLERRLRELERPGDQVDVFAALGELCHRIEACGASEELTNAVSLCSDLRCAIGNKYNPADKYAAERVKAMLAAREER